MPVVWLHPKHIEIFGFAYLGQPARGFVRVVEFRVSGLEQPCNKASDGPKPAFDIEQMFEIAAL